ncbi:MAG: Nramp family divalent metal transporter [Planctomycetaceae bacterium]|nr:Nramp family divalent metal transporter [Planctomycetaceae bacterium]
MEIGTGFFKVGTVPTVLAEDVNMNGVIDANEKDWDGDKWADVVEPKFTNPDDLAEISVKIDLNPADDIPTQTIIYAIRSANDESLTSLAIPPNFGIAAGDYPIVLHSDGSGFIDIDGDGERDGDQVTNVFTSLATGDGMPDIDWTLIAALSALVAISGSGGLTNTTISNYTRDEGWGMGRHVGAIPSMVRGLDLQLSHQGAVFDPTAPGAMPRWKRWYKHIMRDQWVVWAPACFIGLALPSMLSVEFLDRGAAVPDKWVAATMTAEGVRDRVNGVVTTDNPAKMTEEALAAQEANEGGLGNAFWFMTVFCGFLVLAPSMSTSADGVIRRWVDVFWTTSDRLRDLPPGAIKAVYFRVLIVYALLGLVTLVSIKPATLLKIAAAIYNYALGISCLHTLYVNRSLLPRQLQARTSMQIALFLAGLFFLFIGCVSSLKQLGII